MCRAWLTAGLVFAALLPVSAAAEGRPSCIELRQHVRYRGYGYDHVVGLHNHCAAAAQCTVRTDASPQAIEARIEAGDKVELLTFKGSPARSFQAQVDCTLD